jgi:hypothetical protein
MFGFHNLTGCCEAAGSFPEVSQSDEGEATMTSEAHVDFDAPATLRKWPSFNNQRRTYATLGERIREFMARPAASRHLYDIETTPQPPLVSAVLSAEIVAELARLREFL